MKALLQSRCAICEAVSHHPVCEACRAGIQSPDVACRVCGVALPSPTQTLRCQSCIQTPPAFASIQFVGTYVDTLAALIIRAKIRREVGALAALDYLLTIYAMEHPQSQSQPLPQPLPQRVTDYHLLAMPIPTARLMRRGFNLPQLFAQRLSSAWQLPVLAPDSVALPFYQRKQATLPKAARQKNHHHFQINRPLPSKIMLVDDIFTTGQTAGQLAKSLRKNGVQHVDLFVFARGQLGDF
ncbi:hypothetical protein GCU85_02685 [Cardiobacteriales bacterium ML27]|uniref:ComF family protein n=2 Tax=Ostreibacterium oceani TaxID=2654998 RepID=A0A6N7EUI3_9GAMM|nr:hypothetical protein [Ostreibacterium oceani]